MLRLTKLMRSKSFAVVLLALAGLFAYFLRSESMESSRDSTNDENAGTHDLPILSSSSDLPPPACLATLRNRPPRSGPGSPRATGLPRFCGLKSDTPAPKKLENEDHDWLGHGNTQNELAAFHAHLKPYKKDLAGIVFDNSNHEMVVVFFPPVPNATELDARLREGLKDLRIRIREACRTREQMECARMVLERRDLWLRPGTRINYAERRPQGTFNVSIVRDEYSARELRSLLGDMVNVRVVDKLQMVSRGPHAP